MKNLLLLSIFFFTIDMQASQRNEGNNTTGYIDNQAMLNCVRVTVVCCFFLGNYCESVTKNPLQGFLRNTHDNLEPSFSGQCCFKLPILSDAQNLSKHG